MIPTPTPQAEYEDLLALYPERPLGFAADYSRLEEPKFRYTIAACARWEAAYISEWVTYHLSIGFDHIFIYCNDDDPIALYRALLPFVHKKDPEVTFVQYKFHGLQFQMYFHYFRNYSFLSKYTMILDIDEFLVLPGSDNIGRFVDSLKFGFDALYFNWCYYGTNWHEKRPAGDVLLNYTMRQAIVTPFTKVLIETSRIPYKQFFRNTNASVMHDYTRLDPSLKAFNVLGYPMAYYYSDFPEKAWPYLRSGDVNAAIRQTAFIAHFHMKSNEDFDIRVARGLRGDYGSESMWGAKDPAERHAHNVATNEVEDFYLRDYWLRLLARAWENSVFPPATSTVLSRDRPANQSSTLHAPRTPQEDAAMLVSGLINGHSQNHTGLEANPWWYVDLERVCLLREVWLYNRLDGVLDRVARFTISVSNDGMEWQQIFEKSDAALYGGADGTPYRCLIPDGVEARFVCVTIPVPEGYLQFDQIEVYGEERVSQ